MPRIDLIRRDESFRIGDADHWYAIRRVHPDLLREIRRRHTRRLEPETPGQLPREETDEVEVDKDFYDYIIQDWGGICEPGGSEAPCTREHKWLLPGSEKNQILVAAHAVDTQGAAGGDLKNLSAPSAQRAPEGASIAGS